MFKWSDHPGLLKEMTDHVAQRIKAGKSRAQAFREFANTINVRYSANLTEKACEVKYMKAQRAAASEKPDARGVVRATSPYSGEHTVQRQTAVRKVRELVENGIVIDRAFQQVSKETGLSVGQVKWAYARTQESKVVPVRPFPSSSSVDFSNSESMLIDAISDLVTYGRRVENFDLNAFATALGALTRAAANPVKTAEAETAELRREIASLEERLKDAEIVKQDLKAQIEQLRHQLELGVQVQHEVEEMRKDLNFTLTEWVNDPFGKMRATTDRLKIILDRFDNVVKVTEEIPGSRGSQSME